MRSFVTLFVLLTISLVAPTLVVGQADAPLFDYELKTRVQTDQGAPMLVLQAREFIEKGTITLRREGGKAQTVRLGKMKPGQQKRIPFKQPKGASVWKVRVQGESQFNQTMDTEFEAQVVWIDPIELDVDADQVRVGEGRLVLKSNVPLDSVDIEVFDANSNKLVQTTQKLDGKYGDVPISWNPPAGEVGAIRLKATDLAGFWSAVVLEPFWVEIPHREVIFDFGKATWQDSETPKLQETLAGIEDAMKKHAKKGLQMQLYIVGYTDTVGGTSSNDKLSAARARAIATWFRKAGIELPIYYQGFGERVLAVPTPDDTPEARNRRALYILGNAQPPNSQQIPRSAWKRL